MVRGSARPVGMTEVSLAPRSSISALGSTVTAPDAFRSSTSSPDSRTTKPSTTWPAVVANFWVSNPCAILALGLEDRLGQLGAAVAISDVAQEGPLERLGLRDRVAGDAALFLEQYGAELGFARLALHPGDDPLEVELGDQRPLSGLRPVESEAVGGVGRGLADLRVASLRWAWTGTAVPVGAGLADRPQEPGGGLRPAPRPLDRLPRLARWPRAVESSWTRTA